MKLEKNNLIFFSSLSFFFLGIFISGKFDFILTPIFFILLALLFLWFFLKIKLKNIFILNLSLLSIIFFIFGFLRYEYIYQNKKAGFDFLVNQKIKKTFIIDEEPEQKGWHTKLILKFSEQKNRAVAWVPNLPKYSYGDKLEVEGWLLTIKNFQSKDNLKTFDYINFSKKEDIFYEIKGAKIKLLEKHQGNFLKEKLYQFKNKLVERIKELLPEPESSLLAGILIGAKEDMGKKLLEDFRKTGIIHIVVLSGFNLTILAEFIMILLSVFGRKIAAIFGSGSIILFAIMTGASATIIRASLMALLVILAKVMGRNTEALKLLFLAAFLMLLFNPMLLLYDASFQLSFLATLGLLLLSPKIEEWIKFGNFKIFNFKEILAATLSTQIFVFPLILYLMGEISLISPVVNILILIFVPLSMLLGIITLLISYLNFSSALIFGYLNYLLLSYDLKIVEYFASLDFSVFEWKNFSAKQMFWVYFSYFLIFILWKFWKRKR